MPGKEEWALSVLLIDALFSLSAYALDTSKIPGRPFVPAGYYMGLRNLPQQFSASTHPLKGCGYPTKHAEARSLFSQSRVHPA